MAQPELLAILVILVFAGIAVLMIRASKKSQEEKRSRAIKLGFEPLEEVPTGLLSRLEQLQQRSENQVLEVRNLSHQQGLDRDLYLLDLVDTDDEDTWLATDMIAVISPQLALPRFTLTSLPPINTDRMLGNLMDKMLDKFFDWAAKYQRLTRVSFPGNPAFDNKYIVYGRDPQALQRLFSGFRASYLVSLKLPIMMAGSGDFLTLEAGFPERNTQQTKQGSLKRLYQETGELIRLFEQQ